MGKKTKNKNSVKLDLFRMFGDIPLCNAESNKLIPQIVLMLNLGKKVILSFMGVDIVSMDFWHKTIGGFYGGGYDWKFLEKHLVCRDLDAWSEMIVSRVIDNAKRHFSKLEGNDVKSK